MKHIRILTINTVGLSMNGITSVMYDYYSRFNKNFEIHTLADESNDIDIIQKFKKAGFIIHTVPSRRKAIGKYFFEILKIIARNKYDIVHVHGNSASMIVELLAAKLGGCHVRIAHSHNSTCDKKKVDKFLRPFFYNMYTDAFACGIEAGKWLFRDRRFKIIKNGRDIQAYSFNQEKRDYIRNEYNIHRETFAIGHIGNFNEQKNHKFLVNVFKEIHIQNPNSKLFLAGYGHCEGEIRRMVYEYGLAKDVYFLGAIENVSEVLQAMDVMLLPSLYEGLPLVVVEWQMAGLPCLVSETVTSECVFSNLVKFKSLNDSYAEWAKTAIEIGKNNKEKRSGMQTEIINAAKKNGYDIESDVIELMDYFMKRVNGGN